VAQVKEIRLVDDLDGKSADETVEFAIDGKSYEIDLSASNAGRLRDAFAEFVASARKVTGGRARRGAAAPRRPVIDSEPGHPRLGPQAGDEGLRPRAHPVGGAGGLPPGEQLIRNAA
jgi:hypothetical protein